MDATLEILSAIHDLGKQKNLPVMEEAIYNRLVNMGVTIKIFHRLDELVTKRLLNKEDFENFKPSTAIYLYQLTEAGKRKLDEMQLSQFGK